MARPRKSTELALWMNGEHVGRWVVNSRGEHQLHYDAAWVASATGRPVSLSMPLRPHGSPYTGTVVEYFFDNLLPENKTIRTRLAQRFHVPSTNAFDLLQALGRDCAGALQILPAGQPPGNIHRVDAQALDEHSVAQLLARVANGPGGFAEAADDDAFRLSLAGAQEKTALLWQDDQWWLPQGATPSTHILKLPLGVFADGIDMSTSVDNEFICMRLLAAFDVPVAPVVPLRFEDRRVLAVERFDRRPSGKGGWLRLPQEDFAQAFGVSPAVKYEDHGGPGIERIAKQLLGSEPVKLSIHANRHSDQRARSG
jgi:serine/threonine-protein kinase HipA